MEEKPRKCFYVKTKSGTYRIVADYLKYEQRKDSDDVIFLKKTLPDQENPENGTKDWDVAFIKAKDAEIVGLESFISKESVPMTKNEVVKEIIKSAISICSSLMMFVLFQHFKK